MQTDYLNFDDFWQPMLGDRAKGATKSPVCIDIGQGVAITSSPNNEAVAVLGLKKGDNVWAAIKARATLAACPLHLQ